MRLLRAVDRQKDQTYFLASVVRLGPQVVPPLSSQHGKSDTLPILVSTYAKHTITVLSL